MWLSWHKVGTHKCLWNEWEEIVKCPARFWIQRHHAGHQVGWGGLPSEKLSHKEPSTRKLGSLNSRKLG